MRSIKKILAVLLFAGFAGGVHADAIDDYIQAEIARQHVPGLALAIMRHGQLLRVQSYGFANLELQVPVHPDTLFQTGAIGKQFTAVAVMLLVEDGKLQLDESIRKYLPDAPRSWAPITIRQLLNHTSGLPTNPNGDIRREYTDDEMLGGIYQRELIFTPGTRWNYSNNGYVTLGILVKKITGEAYADFLAKRLFAPLGMQTARQIDDRAIVRNRAAGYQLRNGALRNQEWVSYTANSTADGSLYLSALDYARWEAGVFGRKILKPESWAEIAQPARLANGVTYPYGFGWFLERSAGQEIWRHSGSWQGFQTFIIRYLGDELTIVVLANSDSGRPVTIARHVAAMLDPKLAQPQGAPIEDRKPQVTDRLKILLQQIAAGKTNPEDFAFISQQDLAEMMSGYQQTLKFLGSPGEIALFARDESGEDQTYRYRARYDKGVLEVNLSYAGNGKIAGLTFIPADDWNAPIQSADDNWNVPPLEE
jgi:CubicO group peptidase (beta-lactamase class C family)